MQKIPTLFVRDPGDRAHVLPEVNPVCKWVLDGEGATTRKYDGTCVRFDGQHWWARREVKPGKDEPNGFDPVETDVVTGKTVGWEPIEQSPFAKFFDEAWRSVGCTWKVGTYELCGPKVQGNPENLDRHTLIEHRTADRFDLPDRSFDALRRWLLANDYEGLVFHHPDGRMAKIKRRDFAGQ